MDDETLLRQFIREHSETAFGELVARHIDLVYSVALRVVNGDTHLAQDVTQTVFVDLARKAGRLPFDVVLAGWLHRHACFTAATAVRTERRRRIREQTALEMRAFDDNTEPPWEQIAPYIDDGLNQLAAPDRDALVLRFLKRQDLRAVGAALGISEDAAQKRVSRALEKLRVVLNRRVALTGPALTLALTAGAVTAAPTGLAAGVAAASLTAARETGTAFTLLKLMASTKLKSGIIGALIIAGVATPFLIQQEAGAKIRGQNDVLRQQADQLAALQARNGQLSNLLAQTESTPALSKDEQSELLKLRGEVGHLRTDAKRMTAIMNSRDEIARLPLDQVWPARVNHLKQWLDQHPSEKVPELPLLHARTWINSIYPFPLETDEECRRAMSVVRDNAEARTRGNLVDALRQYSENNGGQFPVELSQLSPYLNPPLEAEVLGRYTILPSASLPQELRPDGEPWVITEKAPVNEADDCRHALGLNSSMVANQSVASRWSLAR